MKKKIDESREGGKEGGDERRINNSDKHNNKICHTTPVEKPKLQNEK